jgi:hypothetical protein
MALPAAGAGAHPRPGCVQWRLDRGGDELGRLSGGLSAGLIAYASGDTIGVIDPLTDKTAKLVPVTPGFRIAGPVWGPAPGLSYPVLYFAIHDDRPAETRSSPGVVPYDWIFRADPFTGAIDPLAANPDSESEGPFGLAANSHYLALTVGCCTDYQVDVLDLTQPSATVRVVTKPPDQAALFSEGLSPGADGLVAVRTFGTGAWYFLNPTLGVLNAFPLSLGTDDGPIAFSPDGTMAAVSLPDHGAVVEPVNLAPIIASPTPTTTASAPVSPTAKPATPSPSPAPPRRINSSLPHVDALAWSPDSKQLTVAVNGGIQVYGVGAADGTPPAKTYLAGAGVTGVDWSAPILTKNLATTKPAAAPGTFVDALLDATKLPAAADTSEGRATTRVYLWGYDSSKTSPIATIADATPAILQKYPPLPASVGFHNFHHWSPSGSWPLTGGCIRYRVVITGSVPPTASTFGLAANTPCRSSTP